MFKKKKERKKREDDVHNAIKKRRKKEFVGLASCDVVIKIDFRCFYETHGMAVNDSFGWLGMGG